MPQPSLTPNEKRLAVVCRVLATLYFAAALAFVFSSRAFAVEALSAVLALAMMTAAGTACLVAAGRPRERRHAVLAAIVAQLTAAAAAAVLVFSGDRSAALTWVILTQVPMLAVTAGAYRAAAPGVRSTPAQESPVAAEEEPARIQLKVSKR